MTDGGRGRDSSVVVGWFGLYKLFSTMMFLLNNVGSLFLPISFPFFPFRFLPDSLISPLE